MVELTMPDLAAAMRRAVCGLVDRLDIEQRRQLVFPFDGDMHKRWTYLPGQRPGLRLGELSEEQLEPALELLQLVHSVRGWSDTQLVIRIEAVRRELSVQQAGRAGVDEVSQQRRSRSLHHPLRLRIGRLAEIGSKPVMGGEADILRSGHHHVGHDPGLKQPIRSARTSAGTPPTVSKDSASKANVVPAL
jgi:hypothetical protein